MKTKLRYFFITMALFAGMHQAAAQGTTAFTYQGQLHDGGTNANGTYTMIFALYDAAGGGNEIGSAITNSPDFANGLFTVNLDFGNVFTNGNARWLDITVQYGTNLVTGGPLVSQTLVPRVQVLPAPFALYAAYAAVAATVTNGAIMNSQLATNAVASTNIASGQVVKSLDGLRDVVALTAGANTVLFTNGNTLQLSAVVPNVVGFTSSGTFTVPTNVTRIKVEVWGGGGGGGNASSTHGGGGGGAGGYAFNIFNVTPGAGYAVTVGGGGTAGVSGTSSSFGALISAAGGGVGGVGGSSGGLGGSGGTTSGAIAPFVGSPGDAGNNSGTGAGGNGGSAFGDIGGTGGWGSASGVNQGANGPGAGGAGGVAPSGTGGAGGFGLVVVYY
ncbi:MAG TPA: hypothetical protein VK815_07520 [Candidatus Acidoferrales bacterium]|jgi:hypothetical protein|nr:hypothetical protein [Candidatus Acidoferrales bacterium]